MTSAIEQAFFERIRDDPADDAGRLIYADWLDESGQAPRAELIRVQCALARLADDDSRRLTLRERERQLLEVHEADWTAALTPLASAYVFNRGVIDSVSIDTSRFLDGGAALFELAPVRKVRFLNVGARLEALVQCEHLRLIREIDLTDNALGDRGPILLARSPHLTDLAALNLSFNGIGDKGLLALADTPVFGALKSLRLNDNSRIGVPGIKAIAESPYLTDVTELEASGNQMSDAALRPLFEGPPARRLQRLVINGNRLGDAGTAMLVRSLVFTRMAESDRKVDLRHVDMGPAGARALAESAAMSAVDVLDLEGNLIGDAGLTGLAASDQLRNLRVLSLRENRISDDGIRALARSPLMGTLRVLDLTGNLITQDCADRLHEASVGYDWRGVLQLKVDTQLRTRPLGLTVLGGYYRRPPS